MSDEQPVTESTSATTPATPAAASAQQTQPATGAVTAPAGDGTQTVASGGTQAETTEKAYWPTDWREKAARRVAAEDEVKYKKELERLGKIESPDIAYSMYRQIENTWASKNFIKVPPKEGATEAEIKEYHKSLGVPEKVEDYTKDMKLENGAVIGDNDKPTVDYFADIAHKSGMTPKQFNDLVNSYYARQQQTAEGLDEADENFRVDSVRTLRDEFGPAYKRMTNNIKTLFKVAPGGLDVENPKSAGFRLLNGRTADGRIIGNDPDIVRWLSSLATELNPADSVVEGGGGEGTVDSEIEKIEKIMRTNRAEYNSKYADRYRQLLEAREKIQTRKRA